MATYISTNSIQSPQSSLHEAILYFANKGWRFIPIYGKKPFFPDWPKVATNNIQCLNWWTETFKSCNWGVALGNGLFVLDVDGNAGKATLEQLEREHETLPSTLIVRTGRTEASFHYYFNYPSELTIGNCKLGPGLEIKSSGGQCAFPPSIHPDTGNEYSFISYAPVADAPQWLMQRIQKAPPSSVVSSHYEFPEPTNLERNYAAKALREDSAKLAAMVHGQQRNHALNSLAFSLATMISPGWIDIGSVEKALLDASENNGHVAKHTMSQTIATLQSGLRKGLQRPREPLPLELEPHSGIQVSSQVPLPDQTFNVHSAKGISLICGPDIEDIPQEWIIPDIIPDKTLTGIYGMSGIGKTTFAVGLAAHLSTDGAVIILTNEDGPSHIKRMFKAMDGNIKNLYVENSATEDMPWLLNDCASVEKTIIQLNPRIIVIDSFYSHTPSKVDTDGHSKVAPLLVPLRKLSNKYCSILLIHHDNKSSATDPAQKAGGSHGIVSTIRHNVRVTENPDNADMRVITVFNTNVGKMNPPALQFQLNPFQWSTERVDITAQEAIQPADNLASNATKQVAGKIAQGWLLKQLANGPRLAKELTALASEQINIKYDTLNRARKFLGIESIKLEDNSNQWSLPKKEKKK